MNATPPVTGRIVEGIILGAGGHCGPYGKVRRVVSELRSRNSGGVSWHEIERSTQPRYPGMDANFDIPASYLSQPAHSSVVSSCQRDICAAAHSASAKRCCSDNSCSSRVAWNRPIASATWRPASRMPASIVRPSWTPAWAINSPAAQENEDKASAENEDNASTVCSLSRAGVISDADSA